jgi:hypothetical protein
MPLGAIAIGLCAALAVPAHAQWRRSGVLRWSYEDVTVDAQEGRRRDASFNQEYAYTVGGPLATQMIGEGQGSVNFAQGKSLSQAVASGEPAQKTLGYSFSGSLLPPGLRRYVTLSPSIARTRVTQAWGQPRERRTIQDGTEGLSVGLAIPRLPSVNVARQRTRRWDGGLAPVVDQRTLLGQESVGYSLGPLRLRYRHDATQTQDRLASAGDNRQDQVLGEADLDLNGLRKGPLDRVFLRGSYLDARSRSAGGDFLAASRTGSFYAATKSIRRDKWSSFFGLSHDFARGEHGEPHSFRNSLSATTFRDLARGRLDSQLRYGRGFGRSATESLAEAASLEWRSASGRRIWRSSVDGSWGWDEEAGGTLSDGARQRATYAPSAANSVYAELSTSGQSAMRPGGGGSRRQGMGAGAEAKPLDGLTGRLNYAAMRTRSFLDGSVDLSHNVQAQAELLWGSSLQSSAGYNLSLGSRSDGTRSRDGLASWSLEWKPWGGWSLSSAFLHNGKAFSEDLLATFLIGQTRVEAGYRIQEFYTPGRFTAVRVALSRFL